MVSFPARSNLISLSRTVIVCERVAGLDGPRLHQLDQQVLLVHQEEKGRCLEERVVCNLLKQTEAFGHAVDLVVLVENVVVVGQIDNKDNCTDIVKAVDPLAALSALTTNINNTEKEKRSAKKEGK